MVHVCNHGFPEIGFWRLTQLHTRFCCNHDAERPNLTQVELNLTQVELNLTQVELNLAFQHHGCKENVAKLS